MIGQGVVLASPMAMATVVASVVKGSAVLPRLLPDPRPSRTQPAKPLTAKEADQLRTMMRAVVERGSGSVLADLPGRTGDRQDRDGGVRRQAAAADPRLDGGRPRTTSPSRSSSRRETRAPGPRGRCSSSSCARSDDGAHCPTPEAEVRTFRPVDPPAPAGAAPSYRSRAGRRRHGPDAAVLRLRPRTARAALVDHAGRRRRARRVRPRGRRARGARGDRAHRRVGDLRGPLARRHVGARLHRRGGGAGRGVLRRDARPPSTSTSPGTPRRSG